MERNKRNKWLHIRLTDRELVQIQAYSKDTIQTSLSDFARRVLLKKPVVGRFRDTGTEELLKELTVLKRNLHGLATNYNQIAKKLNTASTDEIESSRIQVRKLEQSIQDSLEKVSDFLDQTAVKWLQS